jgi:hypothetical protein
LIFNKNRILLFALLGDFLVVDVKDVQPLCICEKCPSYMDCGEMRVFCHPSRGRSKCVTERKGCICGGCPTTKKYKLGDWYYCIRGAYKKWPLK